MEPNGHLVCCRQCLIMQCKEVHDELCPLRYEQEIMPPTNKAISIFILC